MPKRQRRNSAEVVQVNPDGTAIVEHDSKQYCWVVPNGIMLDKLTDLNEYNMTIIHDYEYRALINITSVRNYHRYLLQQINPLKHKDLNEWVADN